MRPPPWPAAANAPPRLPLVGGLVGGREGGGSTWEPGVFFPLAWRPGAPLRTLHGRRWGGGGSATFLR